MTTEDCTHVKGAVRTNHKLISFLFREIALPEWVMFLLDISGDIS